MNAPLVKIIADPAGQIYSRPKLVDLAAGGDDQSVKIKKVLSRDEAGFDPAYYFNPPKE